MTVSPDSTARATLHPLAIAALIGGGLLLVAMTVGVWIMIALLQDSREHIRAQDAKTAVLLGKVREATPTASALIGEARPVIRNLGDVLGPLSQSTGAVATATERLPSALNAVEGLAVNAGPPLATLARADLAHVLGAGGALVDALLYRNRLTDTLDGVDRLLAEVRAQDLVPLSARAARATPALMRQILYVQLRTLDVQQRSLQTQLETLGVQREALVHIASIDRKTGGTVPSAP